MLSPQSLSIGILFLFSSALFIYGLISGDLLQQHIWEAQGLQKLRVFLAILLPLAAVGWKLNPHRTLGMISAGCVFYVVAAIGPIPLLSVVGFLFSSWCLGRFLRLDGWIALGTGISLFAWIIGVMALFPINYAATYLLLFAIPVILHRHHLASDFRRIRTQLANIPDLSLSAYASAILLMACFLLHLLVAMKPEYSHDGLAMHLAIPASVAAHHQFIFDSKETMWASMPMMGDWAYTAVHMLGGEYADRLLNFSFLIIILGMLAHSLRRFLPLTDSLLLTALFASSPLIQLLAGSLFIENFWAMNLFTVFLLSLDYWETGKKRSLLLSGVILGIGLATKFGSLGFAAPAFLFLLWCAARWKQKRWALPSMGLVLFFGIPHYLRAWLETGNPVFPFLNHIFKSPYFNSTVKFVDTRYQEGFSFSSLYDLTFQTGRFLEGLNGGWAFQYVFFLPIAFAAVIWKRNVMTLTAICIATVSFIASMQSMSNARYLFPAMILLTIFIGNLFLLLREGHQNLYRAAVVATLVLFSLNLWFLPASGWYHRDLAPIYLFQPEKRLAYRDMQSSERTLVDYMNQAHPGKPVAFIGTNAIAGLKGKAFTISWHHTPFFEQLYQLKSAGECRDFFKSLNIEYLIVPRNLQSLPHAPEASFEVLFSEPEQVSAGWKVVRLVYPPEVTSENLQDEFLPPGEYDDGDPHLKYSLGWMRFVDGNALHGYLTYTEKAEASVTTKFTGSEVTIILTRAFNRGHAKVLIDGEEVKVIDAYSPDIEWQSQEKISGFGPGKHSLEIRPAGTKNPASTGTHIDIDGLIIHQP